MVGDLKKKQRKRTFLHVPALPHSPFCSIWRSLTFAIGNGFDPPDTITIQHSLGGMRKSTFRSRPSRRKSWFILPDFAGHTLQPPFRSRTHSPLVGEKSAFPQNTILGHLRWLKLSFSLPQWRHSGCSTGLKSSGQRPSPLHSGGPGDKGSWDRFPLCVWWASLAWKKLEIDHSVSFPEFSSLLCSFPTPLQTSQVPCYCSI